MFRLLQLRDFTLFDWGVLVLFKNVRRRCNWVLTLHQTNDVSQWEEVPLGKLGREEESDGIHRTLPTKLYPVVEGRGFSLIFGM